MSDTNQVTLNYVIEDTPGETPTNPVFRRLRYTGAPSLSFSPQTVVSNEIAPSRRVQDLITVGADAGGGVDFELAAADHDDMLRMVLANNWAEQANRVGADITSISSGSMTVASGAANGGFGPGDLVSLLGFDLNNMPVAELETGSDDTTLNITALQAETPPDTAQVRKVGYQGSSGEFSLAQSGSVWELQSSGFDFDADALLVPGVWVQVVGFDTEKANGMFRVSNVMPGALQFDEVPTGVVSDDGVGDSVKVFFGDYLRDSSIDITATIEQNFTDHDPTTRLYYRGERLGEMSLQLDSRAIVTGSYTFAGESAEYQEGSRVSGATDLPPLLGTPFNTSNNVAAMRLDGEEVTGPNFALSVSMQIQNNLRDQQAVGKFVSIGSGRGEFSLTGTIETYFGDKTLAQQVVNNTETSFDILTKDAQGRGLLFDVPRLKWTSGAPEVAGKNEDVTASLEFQALAFSLNGEDYTTNIGRYWYLP